MFFGLYRSCFDKNGLAYNENEYYLADILKVFYVISRCLLDPGQHTRSMLKQLDETMFQRVAVHLDRGFITVAPNL